MEEANRANERGRELMESDPAQAELHLRRAVELAPDWSAPFYNLGLLCKQQRRWEESLRYNARAYELAPEDEAARWNLGIAAAAVGDWPSAARCWQALGLDTPEGPGPWDYGLGLIPVRVNPEEAPEVVWCRRLDPARAEILNVPTPECGRRCRDLVLNDGEPRGTRLLHGREVPVFNELQLLEPSGLATFRLEVECPQGPAGFLAQVGELGWEAEDWSSSLQRLCRACSEGRPHSEHDRELPPGSLREFGLAAPPEAPLARMLAGWPVRKLERVL